MDYVIARYRVPAEIRLDQQHNFEFQLWKEVQVLLGIKTTRTMSFHPHLDWVLQTHKHLINNCDSFNLKINSIGPNLCLYFFFHIKVLSKQYRLHVRILREREMKLSIDVWQPIRNWKKYISFSQIGKWPERLKRVHELIKNK